MVLTGDIHSARGCDVVEDPYDPVRYDGVTGRGSAAVEQVCTSVTSHDSEEAQPEAAPALNAAVLAGDPDLQHVDLAGHGDVLADVARRVLAQWWETGPRASAAAPRRSRRSWCDRRGSAHLARL